MYIYLVIFTYYHAMCQNLGSLNLLTYIFSYYYSLQYCTS